MLESALPTLARGNNLLFTTGTGDLESTGAGWFVGLTAEMPIPRANIMVTAINSHGSLSPVKVGDVLTVPASDIELVA